MRTDVRRTTHADPVEPLLTAESADSPRAPRSDSARRSVAELGTTCHDSAKPQSGMTLAEHFAEARHRFLISRDHRVAARDRLVRHLPADPARPPAALLRSSTPASTARSWSPIRSTVSRCASRSASSADSSSPHPSCSGRSGASSPRDSRPASDATPFPSSRRRWSSSSAGVAVAYFCFGHAIQFLESIGGKSLVDRLQPESVPHAVLADDVHLRGHLRVPGRARRPGTGRRRHARPAACAPGATRSSPSPSSRRSSRRAATRSRCSRSRSHSRSSTSSPSASASCCNEVTRRLPRALHRSLGFGLDRFQDEAIDAVDAARQRPGQCAHRFGQDPHRQLRHRTNPRTRGARVLHDAAQGALEPEVRRTLRALRRAIGSDS